MTVKFLAQWNDRSRWWVSNSRVTAIHRFRVKRAIYILRNAAPYDSPYLLTKTAIDDYKPLLVYLGTLKYIIQL